MKPHLPTPPQPLESEDSTEASPHLLGHNHSWGHPAGHHSSGNKIGIIMEETEVKEDEDQDTLASLPSSTMPPTPKLASSEGAPDAKFSPLPWDDCFDESKLVSVPERNSVFNVYLAGGEGPVVLCLHGGGYTGLSFALAAKAMKGKVQVLAMDLRGHGLSRTDDDEDLSAKTLALDVAALVGAMFGSEPPAIVLVGHSMGGAIAARLASQQMLRSLAGLVVIDVVEGTALASLVHMQALLAARPASFESVEKAVEWSVKGGSLRKLTSARISVASQLVPQQGSSRVFWRTKLERTEVHWRGWYSGLSETFVACLVPKLLLLAGMDRLDRVLTIAQMQGKFQMLVIRHSGHAIQEDEPEEFSAAVLAFIARNRISADGIEVPGVTRKN